MMVKSPLKKIKIPVTPNFPKRPPNRNYIPFENPRRKCSVMNCPNFTTPFCGLCELHCRKIHKGNHTNMSKKELDKLIQKYLGKKLR